MPLFAVQLQFDPADLERRLEVRPAHRQYLTELHAQGKLVTAGPYGDQSGALLIYDAADEAEVRGILADDPYTPANVYQLAGLHEWQPLFPLT